MPQIEIKNGNVEGAIKPVDGGHYYARKGGLYSVFCECGAWIGFSRSGGARLSRFPNADSGIDAAWGLCPLRSQPL